MEEYFKNKLYVKKKHIVDRYFETYNHFLNAYETVTSGQVTVKMDRDPPICMYVNSYRRVLSLSDENDDEESVLSFESDL